MATTFKSGDIVGTWQTGHREGDGVIPGLGHWVDETYTWRIRYIPQYKIWVLTASSSLSGVWNNHEVIQSMSNLNDVRSHLSPDFLASGITDYLADNSVLGNLNLQHLGQLSDSYTQDNTTVFDFTSQQTVKNTNNSSNTNNTPQGQAIASSFNWTYVYVLVAVVLLILVVQKFKK